MYCSYSTERQDFGYSQGDIAKSAINRWLAAVRIAESCVRDIDRDPPTKSSAERRPRAVSPKVRADEAGGGSLISPQSVGSGSAIKFLR